MDKEFIVAWDNSANHPDIMEENLNSRKFRDPKTWKEIIIPENYELVSTLPCDYGLDKFGHPFLNTSLFIWKKVKEKE